MRTRHTYAHANTLAHTYTKWITLNNNKKNETHWKIVCVAIRQINMQQITFLVDFYSFFNASKYGAGKAIHKIDELLMRDLFENLRLL